MSDRPVVLATIGYEGASLKDFLATLKEAGVETLIDVRELAISRRQGFSKTALSTALEESDIKYVHLRALGDPKEGRDAAKAGDYTTFERVFKRHLRTVEAKAGVAAAVELARSSNACLMCYERDQERCHRSIVANVISDRLQVSVLHLGVRENSGSNRQRRRREAVGAGQGASPCWR